MRTIRPRILGLVSLLLAGSAVGAAAQSTASPSPAGAPHAAVSPTGETINGWPGMSVEPAGLYSFKVSPGALSWMHKVPETWRQTAPNSVELTFHASSPSEVPERMGGMAVSGSWSTDGRFERPARVLDVHTEVWLLDVGDARVAIVLDSYPDTDPALAAEARAVVDSIVLEPLGTGHRLVFRLEDGWDSG